MLVYRRVNHGSSRSCTHMYPLYLAPHLGRGQTLSESGRNHCAVAPSAEGKTRCRCLAVQVILGMWLIWGTPKAQKCWAVEKWCYPNSWMVYFMDNPNLIAG